MPVLVKSYTSPTLVLLAYDWPAGDLRPDFRGFGIERTPGFAGEERSWLPRQTGCDGIGADLEAPIRTSYWWDASIDASDRGARFQYRVVPVIGPEGSLQLLDQEAGLVDVLVP
jgi:hypothetical protein